MKALVISAGGSKGAFAGGVAEYLIKDCCNDYELFVGCSTGGLLLPHLALGKINKIKKIYTSVTQNDIFSINPFKIKKTKKGFETKINHFNSVITFIKGCATFGESDNLRKLIKESVTPKEFQTLKKRNKKVILAVSNLTMDTVEYFKSNECSYDDFCDWAWASCNFTPFMSILKKNNFQYADGGFGSFVPIMTAIENGACDIDVIILESESGKSNLPIIKNPFSLLFRTFKFMNRQNSNKDVIIAKLVGLKQEININFYYVPTHLTDNPLIFDSEQMTQWWKDGYEFAKTKKPVNFCQNPNAIS
ncbi:patatin-like phospholipase family protein [Flavobacterium sp. K5-23]|uniref:patatin-like phospholipase family protein n=1 Tax=Flavobacterium sp. K5-23 TaxID=2746225 RepID=UPI00200FC82D|nr:patatin-like phospholipase family protein [Flavobacterium sp. K5-23]UQD56629.1 patatin-like phospholipase family protein [Flavobacterium sp. K5-23]